MRLMVAMLQEQKSREIERYLDARPLEWDMVRVRDGEEALLRLCRERFDLLLLHGHLPKMDGSVVLKALWERGPACPPRVLLLTEPELCPQAHPRADCVASIMARPPQIARLLEVLAAKPMPLLAEKTRQLRLENIRELLGNLGLRSGLKGEAYITWLLDHMVPSPMLEREITATLYPACAAAFGTTAAAVERCVRHAVEEVFTRGSIRGIERYFGMTVDPERGKLTNRAFLVGAAEQLRARMDSAMDYSLARARSPKSMEMHHSPAAPTSV